MRDKGIRHVINPSRVYNPHTSYLENAYRIPNQRIYKTMKRISLFIGTLIVIGLLSWAGIAIAGSKTPGRTRSHG